MSQKRDNQAYESGDEDGSNGWLLPDIIQGISKALPGGGREQDIYDKGYEEGSRRRREGDNDNSSDSDSSCCYITTSCLRALDKSQDSVELRAMKVLTREHILKSREGKRDYIKYGRKAPGIVKEIESRPDRMQIWESIYPTLQRIASLVFDGKYEESHRAYKDLVVNLDIQRPS
ncbi:MAG: hypothetical protein AABX96_05310 [Nanoarchaeota archaeon]